MAIRADLVESATRFLLDPSVASSSLDSRLAFLRSKQLTQAEIDASLARSALLPPSSSAGERSSASPPPLPPRPSPYSAQLHQQQYARRDWRDWFIVAAVVGGMSYGLIQFARRYVAPLIAPPPPSQLEEAKASLAAQLERMQAQLAQLAADTAALRTAEEERTQRLDDALSALDRTVGSLRAAGRSRDEDAARLREDLLGLRDLLPRSMSANRDAADVRLRDLAAELTSVKTLMTQRLASGRNPPLLTSPQQPAEPATIAPTEQSASKDAQPAANSSSNGIGLGRTTPFSLLDYSASSSSSKTTSIPAWQMATARAAAANGITEVAGASRAE